MADDRSEDGLPDDASEYSFSDDDDSSIKSDETIDDTEENDNFATIMYDGLVTTGKGIIWPFKTAGKLSINAGVGFVKGVGRHTGNALHSASLATGFHRLIEPPLPLSPLSADMKLAKYSKSYNLNGFMKAAQGTSQKLGAIKSVPCKIGADGKRTLDIIKLGGVGESIRVNVAASGNRDTLNDYIDDIATQIGDISAENKLAGKDGYQGKFHALYDEINKGSDNYHTPAQIIAAFQELQAKTIKDLKEQKQAAIAKIKQTLQPSADAAPLTLRQQNFAALCNINLALPTTLQQQKEKITEKVNQIIEQVEKEYANAEKSVNEYFDGAPGDKDTPSTPGITQNLQHEKEVAEADLLLRISHLERMLKRGYNISDLQDDATGLTATVGNGTENNEHLRAGCLKGVTLKRLLEQEKWDGKYWGKTAVNTLHTRNGLTLTYETTPDGNIAVTGLKIPPQWLLTDAQWEAKVQLALEDYISALKIDQKPGEKLTLTINHPVDSNRNMLMLATYRAALKNGYKPEDIVFTVTGSKEEKGNFTKKPALEVLQACGLGADDPQIKKDLDKYQQERSGLKTRDASQQKSMQTAINKLKFSGKNLDDFTPDEPDNKTAPRRSG